jgi:hypothetical protein
MSLEDGVFNQLKKLVNKKRSYESRRWSDWRLILRTLRDYAIKDTMITSLIQ